MARTRRLRRVPREADPGIAFQSSPGGANYQVFWMDGQGEGRMALAPAGHLRAGLVSRRPPDRVHAGLDVRAGPRRHLDHAV